MNLITKSIPELNALLVRELDETEQGRSMVIKDNLIEFCDESGVWQTTHWPKASTLETMYEELARLTATALDLSRNKHCNFQGCMGPCTGYDLNHTMDNCQKCTRYKEECTCSL